MITNTRKYQLFIASTVLIFAYVAATEVLDRYDVAFRLLTILREKEESVLDPTALAEKKLALLTRKRELSLLLTKGAGEYEQSETGVFDYLNASAKGAGVRLRSLMPVEAVSSGQIREVGFKLQLDADYHHAGVFLNAIETGPVLSRIKKVDLTSQAATSAKLQVAVEGASFILPGKSMR